jgi:hypothetical protein
LQIPLAQTKSGSFSSNLTCFELKMDYELVRARQLWEKVEPCDERWDFHVVRPFPITGLLKPCCYVLRDINGDSMDGISPTCHRWLCQHLGWMLLSLYHHNPPAPIWRTQYTADMDHNMWPLHQWGDATSPISMEEPVIVTKRPRSKRCEGTNVGVDSAQSGRRRTHLVMLGR